MYVCMFGINDWYNLKKFCEVLISFRGSAPRGISKKGGETYEERLKRIEMVIRKNSERINDDIDHNNGVINGG